MLKARHPAGLSPFRDGWSHTSIALVIGVLGGLQGFALGRSTALALRFRAQQALVLAEIERNTRRREDAPDPVLEDRRIELTR